MKIEITIETIGKVKKFIELCDNYIGSKHIISRALESNGKSQIEITAAQINYKNPDYYKLIEFFDGLTSFEQKIIIVTGKLGQIHYGPTLNDFKLLFDKKYNEKNEFYDLIQKSTHSKYLKLGLLKLDLIERIN